MKKNVLAAGVLALAISMIPLAAHVSGNEQTLYATNIGPETTVSELGGLSVTRDGAALAADSALATGDIILKGGNEYVAVVIGDVNGDSLVNSTDFTQVRRAYLGLFELTDTSFKAADVNNDGSVNSTDFTRIRRHFLALFDLSPDGDIEYGQPASVPTSSEVSSEPTTSVPSTPSQAPASSEASSRPTSTYSIVIGPGEDESGWGPIF